VLVEAVPGPPLADRFKTYGKGVLKSRRNAEEKPKKGPSWRMIGTTQALRDE